jgi:hypothetical protein
MCRTICSLVSTAFLFLAMGDAHATGDVMNLLAPASISTGSVYTFIYVRKADGSIWQKQINPTLGPWTSKGNPTGGTSSGPQVAQFTNFFTGVVTRRYYVRGPFPSDPGNILEKIEGQSNWVNTFGMPPGGTTSAPAVSWNDQSGIDIVVRGANNIPFIRSMQATTASPGFVLTDWTQVGTEAINSAPGIAVNSFRKDIVALFSSNEVKITTCQYPACFPSWAQLGGSGAGGVGGSSPSAIWYQDPSSGKTFLSIAVLGSDASTTFVKTYDNYNAVWGGWNNRGGTANSAPSIVDFSVGWSFPYALVHRVDGNNWVNGSGTTWSNVGKP